MRIKGEYLDPHATTPTRVSDVRNLLSDDPPATKPPSKPAAKPKESHPAKRAAEPKGEKEGEGLFGGLGGMAEGLLNMVNSKLGGASGALKMLNAMGGPKAVVSIQPPLPIGIVLLSMLPE